MFFGGTADWVQHRRQQMMQSKQHHHHHYITQRAGVWSKQRQTKCPDQLNAWVGLDESLPFWWRSSFSSAITVLPKCRGDARCALEQGFCVFSERYTRFVSVDAQLCGKPNMPKRRKCLCCCCCWWCPAHSASPPTYGHDPPVTAKWAVQIFLTT